jgi:hypothetical protein
MSHAAGGIFKPLHIGLTAVNPAGFLGWVTSTRRSRQTIQQPSTGMSMILAEHPREIARQVQQILRFESPQMAMIKKKNRPLAANPRTFSLNFP